MSGGRLVVVDRGGRDVKAYPLRAGLARVGRGAGCHVRVLQPAVRPLHATLLVKHAQTVIRNESDGVTLVNGHAVSVAALQHGDTISVGDRTLRWEYAQPAARRPLQAEPALHAGAALASRRAPRASRARASSPPPPAPRDPQLAVAIEMRHRASMPASAGGKQVAIVQPQRRDNRDQIGLSESCPASGAGSARPRPRPRPSSAGPSAPLATTTTTKAEQWIESRKSTPRKATAAAATPKRPTPKQATPKLAVPKRATPKALTPKVASGAKAAPRQAARRQSTPRRSAPRRVSARHSGRSGAATPLRVAVLKRAQSAHKPPHAVMKIEDPLRIDHTKQAALLLMAGRRPTALPSPSPAPMAGSGSPGASARRSQAHTGSASKQTPSRGGAAGVGASPGRSSQRGAGNQTSTLVWSDTSSRSSRSVLSPVLPSPSPRKSALKDPAAKRSSRKAESIKFDLSNLESSEDTEALSETYTAQGRSSEESEATLRQTPSPSPSPRRSIHSRSGRILAQAGSPLSSSRVSPSILPAAATPAASGSPRGASRASALVLRALSPRASPRPRRSHADSYSVVDLVSFDSDGTTCASLYDSLGTTATSSVLFGTPQGGARRSTSRAAATTSTPYGGHRGRSHSSPDTSARKYSPRDSASRRSHSLTTLTPENAPNHVSINSTRISRASKSRSRIGDSELQFIDDDSQSPRSSRKSRASRSMASSDGASDTKRGSRRKLTIDLTFATGQGGSVTPVNQNSPEEVGTPVLSIQSLLDSSQRSSSARRTKTPPASAKRKTIGVLRSRRKQKPSPRSRSFGHALPGAKGGRGAKETTPTGAAAPLVPEAVKNKHSTAKKPQSKRSIIDDLDESDIVKQLFNSPVKRNLSHSMSEMSRRHVFEDEGPSRPQGPGSPRLDGVRRLYGRAPRDDLRRVSGVKRALARAPEDDLRDVRGVKRLFARQPRDSYGDVSGVEALLDEPRDPERQFDRLLGRPPLRAKYSKSLLGPRRVARPARRRSLRASVDAITTNVEAWLQQELDRCLHRAKANAGTPRALSKELQKLATDTVEGNEIRSSRARTSTANDSRAAAALAYSARRLPLKKRSFAEASLERSTVSANSSKSGSSLPIKKRAVVHSTPVKGRTDLTMNATDIRAVSPIAPLLDAGLRYATGSPRRADRSSVAKPAASPKPRRAAQRDVADDEQGEPSPPKRRPKSAKAASSPKTPAATSPKARGRRATGKNIVAAKSPKPKRSTKSQVEIGTNDSLPLGKRGKRGTKAAAAGDTNAPVTKATKETKAKRARKVAEPTPTPQKPKRGRKQNTSAVSQSPKPSPRKTRGKAKPASPGKASRGRRGGRPSLVLPKRPPALSPKPAPKAAKRKSPKVQSPPRSPRVVVARLALPKPSPQMKPQGSKRGKRAAPTPKATPKKAAPKRAKARAEVTKPAKKVAQKKSPAKKDTPKKSAPTKRGRPESATKTPPSSGKTVASPKAKRRTKQNAHEQSPKRRRKAQPDNTTKTPAKRAKRDPKAEDPKVSSPAPGPSRGRKRKSDGPLPVPAKVARRSPKVAKDSPRQATRGRKATAANTDTLKGRSSSTKATTKKTKKVDATVTSLTSAKGKAKSPAKPSATKGSKKAKPAEKKGSKANQSASSRGSKATKSPAKTTTVKKSKVAKSPAKSVKSLKAAAKAKSPAQRKPTKGKKVVLAVGSPARRARPKPAPAAAVKAAATAPSAGRSRRR